VTPPARLLPVTLALGVAWSVAGASDWAWDVTERPPVLSNPRHIDMSTVRPVHTVGWKRFLGMKSNRNSITCDGRLYRIDLGDDEDAIVTMSGSEPLRYPVHVRGGHNVRVVGLQIELVTQHGCDVGELPNRPVEKHPNSNIHPRVPGSIALRLQQSGTSFVEGLHVDVRGHEADCIVSRNPDWMTDEQARRQRDVVIQNTWCSGVEGQGKTDIGDGVHGDLFQNQAKDVLRRLVFENVSMRTSQEGIVIHGSGRFRGTDVLLIRRYDYTWDPRYVGDDDYERFGLALAGWPGDDWRLEDVYIDDYRDGQDYLKIGSQRYGNAKGSKVQPHPAIHAGAPPGGAYAPPERTGLRYSTPHSPLPAR